MNNVVNLTRRIYPDDLLTFNEVFEKYGYKYNFIYKWCVIESKIPCYDKAGYRAIREADLLEFRAKRVRKWQV